MKRTLGLFIIVTLCASAAWADPDGDAVLEQARSEYQESTEAETKADEDDGTVFRYERKTTESESWSMQSNEEPEWWTEGVGDDRRPAASSPESAANREPTGSGDAEAGPRMQDFRPESAKPKSESARQDRRAPMPQARPAQTESVTFVPLHVSVFGEEIGGPVATNIAVSPLISSVHSVNGLQGAGVIANVDGEVHGFQMAGVMAVSEGDAHGMQSAGVFVSAEGDVYGLQSAGVFTATEGTVNGIQSAGVFNTVGRNLNGIQSAGVFNSVEGSVRGVQAAGVFNSAGDVNGAQVGLVNVAEDVHGVQVGLVNVSENLYGLPIGLINIVKNGIRNFTVWFEDTGYNYVGYQYGSNVFYTLAYGGLHKDDWFESYDSLVTGLGLGMRIKLGGLYVDADISAKHVAAGESGGDKLSNAFAYDSTTYPAARLVAGLSLGRRLSIFAGADFDVHIPGYTERGKFHTGRMVPVDGEDFRAELYPKYFVGFSF